MQCCVTAHACQCLILCIDVFYCFLFLQICNGNPIIHLRPLTAWDFMTCIHPLRNLLIGVLGSSLGHALDDLCLFFRNLIGSIWIVMFVVPYLWCFCMSSSLAKRILNHVFVFLMEFCKYPASKTSKPRKLKLTHTCK